MRCDRLKHKFKNLIKKYVPDWIILPIKRRFNSVELFRLYFRDYLRFKKYSFGINVPVKEAQLEAMIIKTYHSIEKGLSFKEIKLGFGSKVIKELLELLRKFKDYGFDTKKMCFKSAISALNEYVQLHENAGYDMTELKKAINMLSSDSHINYGGTIKLLKSDLLRDAKGNYEELANSRYSVRDFSDEEVDIQIILDAIKIARKTPSVCNRQAWKVRIIKDPQIKKIIRENQNGNRGFGDKVDTFLLITTDNSCFSAPRERNQGFIDGGMFSMSLLHALQFKGLATCPLSAALTVKQEKNIRNSLKIKNSENLILFIAVGHYTNEFKVPKSARKDINNLYEII